jgi:hypothetical protein
MTDNEQEIVRWASMAKQVATVFVERMALRGDTMETPSDALLGRAASAWMMLERDLGVYVDAERRTFSILLIAASFSNVRQDDRTP